MKIKIILMLFFIMSINAYGVEVRVPDLAVDPGAEFTTAINIDDATGIAGGDITLEYDTAILTVKDVRTTDISNELSPITNVNIPGMVRFAMASVSGLKGGRGALLEIDFVVEAAAKGSTLLELSEVALFNELGNDIRVTTRDGIVTIKEEQHNLRKTLIAGNSSGKTDGLISVNIQIDDATGIAGGNIVLLYDANLLFIQDIEQTDLLTGLSVIVNKAVAGKISIAMASNKGISTGRGAIFSILFRGRAVGISKFDFESASLFDEDGNDFETTAINGKITVEKSPVVENPVIKQPDGKLLVLQAAYKEANVHGHTYVDIWKGEFPVKAGQFLEFQVVIYSGNPTFSGSVDLITSDGKMLGDSGAKDQNGISAHPSADISDFARDKWYHRKISLESLAGKTMAGVMIATDSDKHRAGLLRVYVDNIQITDGANILKAIYLDEATIPITGAAVSTSTDYAGTAGMIDYSASVVGETSVMPKGKLVGSWGKIRMRDGG